MATACVIENGVVLNSIVVDDDADLIALGGALKAQLTLGPPESGIGWTYDGTTWAPPAALEPSLDDLRTAKIAAIVAAADTLLAAGAPVVDGLRIALDDGARADLTAMATTATAAASGAVSWPDSYSRGWISVENVRLPLPTPAAGLALAAIVGDWYARIVQHRRDLKDLVLVAEDAAALDAIDITTGWSA